MNDKKLVQVFSKFIRLRDSNKEGFLKCFTCPNIIFWKQAECGHGISRGKSFITKFDERNNQGQCHDCNCLKDGRQDRFKEEIEKKYGPGTWEELERLARSVNRVSQKGIDEMVKYYSHEVKRLISEKEFLII